MNKPADVDELDQATIEVIQSVTDRIASTLDTYEPRIAGAVLAGLLASFIASHEIIGDRKETIELRQKVLSLHIDAVLALIDLSDHEQNA